MMGETVTGRHRLRSETSGEPAADDTETEDGGGEEPPGSARRRPDGPGATRPAAQVRRVDYPQRQRTRTHRSRPTPARAGIRPSARSLGPVAQLRAQRPEQSRGATTVSLSTRRTCSRNRCKRAADRRSRRVRTDRGPHGRRHAVVFRPGGRDHQACGRIRRVYGLEPRHLRSLRNAADRQASTYIQVVAPLLRQKNPAARERAEAELDAMLAWLTAP